jgi:hypothetical protein
LSRKVGKEFPLLACNNPEECNSHTLHGESLKSLRAYVIDTTAPLTHNLPRIEAEKIMKYEYLIPEIKNIWKLNYVSISGISTKGVVTRTL